MSDLLARVLSAVVALCLLSASIIFFGAPGLRWLALAICGYGVFEFYKMTLHRLVLPLSVTCAYLFLSISSLFVLSVGSEIYSRLIPLLFCGYSCTALWLARNKLDNDKMLQLVSLSLFGVFYSAILPSSALRLLENPKQLGWFFLLLAIVFCGDIFAYFGGKLFAGPKLMPLVSPSKTFSGSISGFAGSLIGAYATNVAFNMNVALGPLISIGLLSAFLAQSGDLLESLIKRVANQKDSGSIMPGHGGVLDRLDGVYFAAPAIYWASSHF